MLRENYERQLQRLQDELLIMGSMVQKAIIDSVEYLKERNFEGSRRLIAEDAILNKKRFDIEGDTLALIATQQPMARDLRTLAAILEITTELERIGDYAKGISRINLMLGPKPLLKPLVDIPRMAEKGVDMLRRALEAFIRQDAEAAAAIPHEDDGSTRSTTRSTASFSPSSSEIPAPWSRPTISSGRPTTWSAQQIG